MRLVVPYRKSAGGDRALARAAQEADDKAFELTVLIPFVAPTESSGCCGIRGEAWIAMLHDVAQDEAAHARGILSSKGARATVEVVEGGSVHEIVSAYLAADDQRLPALPAGGRKGPFSRSVTRRTAKALLSS